MFSLLALVYTSCGKCYNESESFEGFDLAVVDNLGNTLLGQNNRYDINDVHLMIDELDLIYGYYKANEIYYFLVDYGQLQPGDYSGYLELRENETIPVTLNLTWEEDTCFPHNDLSKLNFEGEDYEVDEEYKVHIIK